VNALWLSHHRGDELHRTYEIGRARVCARCLGTYPVMFALIAVQLVRRAPLESRWDAALAMLFLPALADWALGRFLPRAGSNLWRTATGALLGIALGRTLFVHLERPFPFWLLVQAAGVTAVAVPVILLTYRKRQGVDQAARSSVQEGRNDE